MQYNQAIAQELAEIDQHTTMLYGQYLEQRKRFVAAEKALKDPALKCYYTRKLLEKQKETYQEMMDVILELLNEIDMDLCRFKPTVH